MHFDNQMTSAARSSYFQGEDRESIWGEALSLTLEMLDAGRSGEWDHVIRCEQERRERIKRLFEAVDPYEESQLIRNRIVFVLECDEELQRISRNYQRKAPDNVIPFRPRSRHNRRRAPV